LDAHGRLAHGRLRLAEEKPVVGEVGQRRVELDREIGQPGTSRDRPAGHDRGLGNGSGSG
jgi:hypothetical protein